VRLRDSPRRRPSRSAMVAAIGLAAALLSSVFYGTYNVPVKKYEIHDGLAFQWYQCNGILLAALVCSMLRNKWQAPGEVSSGFYVCPSGIVSGLVFQVGNICAMKSVKLCGLSSYCIVHELSQLGVAYFFGVYGPRLGIPTTPPSNVALAGMGILFVLLGTVPIMRLRKELPPNGSPARSPAASEDRLFGADGSSRLLAVGAQDDVYLGFGGVANAGAAREDVEARARADVESRTTDSSQSPALQGVARKQNRFSGGNFTWEGLLCGHRRGVLCDPPIALGDSMLVVEETVSVSDLSGIGDSSPLLPMMARGVVGRRTGLALALLAGALQGCTFLPLLPWKAEMKAQGIIVTGFDSFFSMGIGLYLSSTLWLLTGGAVKKYRGEKLDKVVLRPALFSGVLYGCAALNFLFALMLLPYAACVAFAVGGAIAVSQMWGVFRFGEAEGSHNRRLVVTSLIGVLLGVVLTGIAA